MDIHKAQEVEGLCDRLIELSEKYSLARKTASEAEIKIKYILADKMPDLRKIRRNVGIDMAFIELMALEGISDEIRGYFEEYVKETNHYKSLEKIIEAIHGRIDVISNKVKGTEFKIFVPLE